MKTLITLKTLPVFLLLLVVFAIPALAGPVYWDWPRDRPFAELDLDGAALDADGNLVGGLAMREIGPAGPEVFWRVVPDGRGGFITGSGHGGEIYRVTLDGDITMVAQLEATEVFSLLPRADGSLLVGCGPEGGFYLLDDQGDETLLGSVAGGYVWAMAARPGDGDEVWLATGSPASVYRYRASDDLLEEVLTLPAQNALDLTFDDQGRLWVATQGPGLVYRLDPETPDDFEIMLETEQDEARQFLRGPEGGLYMLALQPEEFGMDGINGDGGMGNGPPPGLLALLEDAAGPSIDRAALYHIDAPGGVRRHWSGPLDLMIAAWSPDRGWLAAGPLEPGGDRSVLHRLTPPAGHQPVASWYGGDVLDMQIAAEGEVLVAQAHPGTLALLDENVGQKRFAVSAPLDAGRPVRWGRLRWTGREDDADVEWSVRGGNRSAPDDSWTSWSKGWSDQDHAIPLEATRFLQWRVRFGGGADDGTVTEVSVSAWRDNLPPVIQAFNEEQLQQMHLGPMGGRTENVTQRFRSGLQAEFSQGSSDRKYAGPERASGARSVRIFTWTGTDPDGDRITWDLEYRSVGATVWRSILSDTPEMLGSWDTSEVTDGRYDLRLTARDGRDNPHDQAGFSTRSLGPVTVDNTAPVLDGCAVETSETGFRIRLKADDAQGALAGAMVLLPDGTRERLDPVDGICDSRHEEWDVEVAWPRPGTNSGPRPWQVEIEVWDLGGNLIRCGGEVR